MNKLAAPMMNRRDLMAGLAGLAAAWPAFGGEAPLRGAGATFPYPVYARWAEAYQRAFGVQIDYEPVGSGAGVERLAGGHVDFGASDVPLSPEELQRIGAMQFPSVIGGVVPVVNLSGVKSGQLRLTGPVLADIYLGKVSKWNDPALTRLNPDLGLPSSHITVVHRSEASGTTHLWSDFLARSSTAWRMNVGVGKTLAWPAGVIEVAASGNEGVAAAVQRTRASIGYVEYAYASQHHLSTASLRNHDGQFVTADPLSFAAAAVQARWREEADLQQSLIDLPGPQTWPVVSASHVLLRTRPQHPERTLAVLKFLDWALTQGQPLAAELGYLPLPDAAARLVEQAWRTHLRTASGSSLWPPASASR